MRDLAVLPPGASRDLLQVLQEGGFAATDAPTPLRLVLDGDLATEEQRDFVLGGGGVLLAVRSGPLLPAFGLQCPDGALSGVAEPVVEGLPPVELAAAWPVSGSGYALYRLGGACVALDARRGAGRVVLAGSLEPRFLLACLLRMAC